MMALDDAAPLAIWLVRIVGAVVAVGLAGFVWSVVHSWRQRRALQRMSKR